MTAAAAAATTVFHRHLQGQNLINVIWPALDTGPAIMPPRPRIYLQLVWFAASCWERVCRANSVMIRMMAALAVAAAAERKEESWQLCLYRPGRVLRCLHQWHSGDSVGACPPGACPQRQWKVHSVRYWRLLSPRRLLVVAHAPALGTVCRDDI